MKHSETDKLLRMLERVQQGFVISEKYARLFDSHIAMTAIHEASHAVIATLLGVKVLAIGIAIEHEEFDGREGISAGQTRYEPSSYRLLDQNLPGRVVKAAITLASTLTREFKFEYDIEKHLVEAGFGGDNDKLERLDDETAVLQGGAILRFALDQPFVIDLIEAVAEVLNEKKMMLGKELTEIVFCSFPQLTGSFTRKEVVTKTETIENALATVLAKPKVTPFKFMGTELEVCSFLGRLEADGRVLPFCTVSLPVGDGKHVINWPRISTILYVS
jgi:hypothetical protein